jgi:hypothetical protein
MCEAKFDSQYRCNNIVSVAIVCNCLLISISIVTILCSFNFLVVSLMTNTNANNIVSVADGKMLNCYWSLLVANDHVIIETIHHNL